MSIASELNRIIGAKASIASAINQKSGTSNATGKKLSELAPLITALPSGGLNTSDATANAADMLSGKTAYARGVKITGSMQKYTGSTFITPTSSQQTLATAGKYMDNNITVGAHSGSSPVVTVLERSGSYTGGATVTVLLPFQARMVYGYAKLNNSLTNCRMFGGHSATGSSLLSGPFAKSDGGVDTKTYTVDATSLKFIPNGTGGSYILWAIG